MDSELDERKRKILKAIIQTYLETGEPVGSRTISKYTDLNLSSATIRNEMSDLEELGYIVQPHTSAGRIPSDAGYRLYVDELMREKEQEVSEIKEMMIERTDKMEKVLKQVVKVLADSGFELYLLGRGWENHPSIHCPNIHRIDDRIPYGQTLAYMADAKINLNVMPWFKAGTHDRIFNILLQHSLPLTDSSSWIDENFTDGVDIQLYDLKALDRLPHITRQLLSDPVRTWEMIEKGYEKAAEQFTWKQCAEQILRVFY